MPPKKSTLTQSGYLENFGKTAPAVPAIRSAVEAWRAKKYAGATATSRELLNYWFQTDHRRHDGTQFAYHVAQRAAVEALIYVFEVAKTRRLSDLYQQFVPAEQAGLIRLPDEEDNQFARYAIKMATGSGKTKVMALAIAWQYFNAIIEADPAYASHFLIIAPNVIVYERLFTDFAGGAIFRTDPIIPKDKRIYWDVQAYMRGDSERASSLGAIYLTNVQQLYDPRDSADDEPDIMTSVLGAKPSATVQERDHFRERLIARNSGRVLVLNDEAHHTHDPQSVWNQTIRGLHADHPLGVSAQLDFSATPRYSSGALFGWTISDYTLKQAIIDRIVKRPMKGITDLGEVPSAVASVKYEPFLVAAVERWREYRTALAIIGKKPLLFVMMSNTDEADSIGDWLRTKYPSEFTGDKTLIIHTDRNGEVSKKDLDVARKAARVVDHDDSPVNAIVSVLMLREGWDVQNVTVIVGLRPYTAKANILPEQTIGRGLRLMFRGITTPYTERVDIIGNKGFISFIEQLEKDEGVELDTYEVGKDKLVITVIQPEPERAVYDITLPSLSPILARQTNISDAIEAVDLMNLIRQPLPLTADSVEAKQFNYQGVDILTLEVEIERQYTIPQPQTYGEIVSYIAQLIAGNIKLPSQFAVLAPKVRDFLKYRAFGREVDLEHPDILRAISRRLTVHVTVTEFTKALRDLIVEELTPRLESEGRALSTMAPFPWSQETIRARKTVFNLVPCDNRFEAEFARFADHASDVARFTKLPLNFGFSIAYTDKIGNLRHYYPDFVVVDTDGVQYVVETKGREDTDVINKDRSAVLWCENATLLTGQTWRYVKVMQHEFQTQQPASFADCAYTGTMDQRMFPDA